MPSSNVKYLELVKPILDRMLAACLLALCSPLLALIAIAVRFHIGSPVLFVQSRPGKNSREFRLVKFRTMTEERDSSGKLLPDEQRTTRFGKWLRSTSLDELPELWNVLRGEMSFVGPRPLLTEYLPLYTPTESRRHTVLPGISGWAQVHGRNSISWDDKLALDVWYVDHAGFFVDVQVLALTILRVLRRSGIHQPGLTTVEPLGKSRPGVTVFGAGGHASVVVATLQAAKIRVTAVYDDDPVKWGRKLLGMQIAGPLSDVTPQLPVEAVIALGDSALRRDVATFYQLNWIRVVHPTAVIHSTVTLGVGTVVMANAVVQPNCSIGMHAIVNTSASIDHDCQIGDFAHIAPGAVLAGGVTVGEHSLIGVGGCVAPGVTIGRNTVVGAGAVVVDDLPDDVVAVGCPAQVIRKTALLEAAK